MTTYKIGDKVRLICECHKGGHGVITDQSEFGHTVVVTLIDGTLFVANPWELEKDT